MGKIVKVSGPLVVASGLSEANMADVVRVGEQHLIGEILTMSGDSAAIQVYEETSGLGPGAEVVTTGAPLSVELGPGLIENIYDGIQRPLEVIRQKTGGNFLPRGEELGGDRVPKMAVYQDSLHRMEERTGQPYDWYMDLDITSPLRTESDIENAFAKKQSRDDLDLVFSVCEARRNPWFNMVKTVDDHVEQVCKSEFTGRQQAPDVYDVNASIYVFKRDFLATNTDGILWRGKIGISVMMDTGIIDIDSEHDYLLMEAIAQHLYAHYPEFAAVQENIRD